MCVIRGFRRGPTNDEHEGGTPGTRMTMEKREFVALMTFVDEYAGMFYEAGGIYDHPPQCKGMAGARPLQPGEHVAVCPRCGQRFATVEDGTAEANRDVHFDGDEDIPSICRNYPPRQLRVVGVAASRT